MWIFNLILSILPVIIILLIFHRKDKYKKEPFKIILLALVVGAFGVLIVFSFGFIFNFILEKIQSKYLKAFLTALIPDAIIGEGTKFFGIYFFIYKRKEFDEIVDGIVYAVSVSLGFALVENIIYSINSTETALIRAITAVPGHAVWSGIMGYYIGIAKFRKKGKSLFLILGFLFAIFLRTTYSFLVLSGTLLVWLIAPLIFFGFVFLMHKRKKALLMDVNQVNV